MLRELVKEMGEAKVTVHFARLSPGLLRLLDRSGIWFSPHAVVHRRLFFFSKSEDYAAKRLPPPPLLLSFLFGLAPFVCSSSAFDACMYSQTLQGHGGSPRRCV
jgi:hypothetical protein